ncbi:serine/threonine protein kinase [Saccharopolyspora erythraea NRRL 2338]|uniref:non-specific serine/threonine protein kinase n=2 Tax=Saccharopolyspora erythraea TaxID=1836 RepID=A4F830_SACEN|nr:serine/threonine-protein kinase [Saccharopolyspora erythraea]EQD86098.1 serine/threonine protein kinase [Saccharopolyspora erythraea D]PFG94002.1 serine/threonine protein kinase [Saccharopolyspora erythraea NRRL 2338]QRK90810.1 serine/threonine protein kinase [Saccharopolyspora erythraea]CAM00205.1 serine/threonine protein kinase [Saccharopolyspora erythraea NRRL 2338]
MADSVGGRYELRDEIGSGGMGSVWRAFDGVLDREVAVKRISPETIAASTAIDVLAQRFQREARVTARIQHHGVPQVYDAGLDENADELFLVMELVRGVSLRAFISPGEPLPVSWAAAFAAQICTVLSHAHAVPVVHRDLKPGNVLVTTDGAIKVLDFGIAAILRSDVTPLTATGERLGTSQYMSPEQVRGDRVTPHSDLYSLGCVLYELLSGYPVFEGEYGAQQMYRHVEVAPCPLRDVRTEVPAELDRLVLDLLAKSPDQRPVDAYEVYEQLLPFLPAPGSVPETTGSIPGDMPDPTLVFRRPNAPRSRHESGPVLGGVTSVEAESSASRAPRTELRNAISEAFQQSGILLREDRHAQAADVLEAAIRPAGEALGAENPEVLELRLRRAIIMVFGGEHRAALPEFDALEAAYTRTAGPTSEKAVECLRQAADCRAELGQVTLALRQFHDALSRIRATGGDVSEMAIEVRLDIGKLHLLENNLTEARETLQALHDDVSLVHGPDHAAARETAELLERTHV